MRPLDLTEKLSDEYVWAEIQYLDPEIADGHDYVHVESESPISLFAAVVLVIAIFTSFAILIVRI